jgi:arylsulfatase A
MNTKSNVRSLSLLLLLACCAFAAERPNIIVAVADDLGYGDLGCYGEKVIRTPNLDRLATEGMRLTSCYAAHANCSPSRAALMTGRTPMRLGIYNWIPMLSPMHLRREEITIATLLRNAGYATALIGKWHLNGMFNLPGQPQPNDHGFEYWFATQNVALPSHRNPYNFVRNAIPVGEVQGFSAQIVAEETTRWLTEKRDKTKPFFLFVCFHEPHEPIATDPQFAKLYDFPNDPSHVAHHGNVTQLDDGFGRIMRVLDEQKLRDNTLVFFTSDNGPAITPMHPHGSAGPLREKKGHLYEGGIRVPGIVRWPGNVRAGSVSDEPVSGVDLLPTLCAITDVAPPKDRALDGVDLAPIFAGRPLARTQPLYWHFNHALSPPKVAMRVGDWKLLAQLDVPTPTRFNDIRDDIQRDMKRAELSTFELYNLRDDIGEAHDLAAQQPERVKIISAMMTRLYREVRDEWTPWPEWTFANFDGPRIERLPYWKPKKTAPPK